MSVYLEDVEILLDQIEAKSRDPDYNPTMYMKDTKPVWCEDDLDEVMTNNPSIKHSAWGVDSYESVKKALWSVLGVKTAGEVGDTIEYLGNDVGTAREMGLNHTDASTNGIPNSPVRHFQCGETGSLTLRLQRTRNMWLKRYRNGKSITGS